MHILTVKRMSNLALMFTALILMAVCLPLQASARPADLFRSDILARMASAMKIENTLSEMPDGISVAELEYNGRPLSVVKQDGVIRHIGFSVFPAPMRRQAHSPFYDVIERYALIDALPIEKKKTVDRELFEEGVHFSKGSIQKLPALFGNEKVEFSLTNNNGKEYHAVWTENGRQICEVTLPYTYEFLHGTTMDENERRLIEDFKTLSATSFENYSSADVERSSLITYFPTNYYIKPGQSYYFDSFNTNRYYMMPDSLSFAPIYDAEYPRESLANVCTSLEVPNNLKLSIKLVQYNYKSTTVEMPLSSVVDYFLREGCTPFFGIIESTEKQTVCELLLRNEDEGYCHILKITAPAEAIAEHEGTYTARMNSYIPISKISSLFDEQK